MKDARGTAERLTVGMKVSVTAAIGMIHALARTWRFRSIGEESMHRIRADKTPTVLTIWHGDMLPMLWYHRNQGIVVLVSEHKDGEVVARILQRLGYSVIRGSTSRGAGRALLGVVRELKDGHNVAITPDGPRGPCHKFAPGALVAAHRAGVPLIAGVPHIDRYWKLSTWDGFVIPMPFARITIAFSAATRVSAETIRDAAEEAPRVERMMEELGRIACA